VKHALLATYLMSVTAPLAAQTGDAFFTRDSWNLTVYAPRVSGLGGTFVTMADGSAALPTNPAAAFTNTTEFAASFGKHPGLGMMRWDRELAPGLELAWGGRAYRETALAFDGNGANLNTVGRTIDTGRVTLVADALTVGGAVRWIVGPELASISIGGAITASWLRADGTYQTFNVDTHEDVRVAYAGDALRIMSTLGVVAGLGNEYSDWGARLGAAARLPVRNGRLQRQPLRIVPGESPVRGENEGFDYLMPGSVSVGGDVWFLQNHVRLAGQADFVDYDRVQAQLRGAGATIGFPGGAGSDYRIARRPEWGLGIELTVHNVRGRAGVRLERERNLVLLSPAAPPSGVHCVGPAVGASYDKQLLGHSVRFDMDYARRELIVGLLVGL
jgi:hypothetical protein